MGYSCNPAAWGRWTAVALALTVALGCATTPDVPSVQEAPLPSPRLPLLIYPGDVVDVKFTYWPELDDKQVVRPDGRISLRFVSEVDVAWQSPEEVRQKLLELYGPILQNPDIAVVLHTEDRYVFVGGEIRLPGGLTQVRVPIQGRLTALQAVLQAGGLDKRSAKLSNVLIVRQFPDRQYARTVDLRESFKRPDSEPFYLEPFDIVFVPRTNIDRADQWVDQYMNQLVPDWVNLNFGISQGRTEIDGQNGSVSATVGGATINVPR